MNDPASFDPERSAPPGELAQLTPLVRRMLAGNASAMTYKGTNTYVVGHGEVSIIDPGPEDPRHIEALLDALNGERIAHILVTHTHRDHSPGARLLSEATGIPIHGCALPEPARMATPAEWTRFQSVHDQGYAPALILKDGECVQAGDHTLTVIATPGHTQNHLTFALQEESSLFSGDHVMGWSTTVIAPPDGNLKSYIASLEKLRRRSDRLYWPAHGGPVTDPQRLLRGLLQHRNARESAILNRLEAGDEDCATIVRNVYGNIGPALQGAASLSVLAHLEELVESGRIDTSGPGGLESRFFPKLLRKPPEN
ncbi:MBL fold metallo-hydrolase [Beijerinckia mobilis]|uniref:MBL fold metallo-hydrolase n=1 Tax=Beijerinckia mobilis TaxID=231434 RepID=UPI0005580DAB|nr:MBL fold metallo-hydrolase [Beijerinckia mobilis]